MVQDKINTGNWQP